MVAIKRLLDDIEARGDIALVVDSGGEFAAPYYRKVFRIHPRFANGNFSGRALTNLR